MIVDYNPKTKKFEIEATFAENRSVVSLPNRSFSKARKIWLAPALYRNIEHILATPDLRNGLTKRARAKVDEAAERKKIKRVPFPSWYPFKTTPFSHQRTALDEVWGLDRFALFMDMGTGKTKIAIDHTAAKFMEGEIDAWVIFCPVAIKRNWVGEWAVHAPESLEQDIPVYTLDAMPANKRDKLVREIGAHKRFIIIVGIESLQQKFKGGGAYDAVINLVANRRFAVTIDESHLVKNHDATRSRNIEEIAQYSKVCSIMTGTPSSQGLMDLFQPFKILDPDIIGLGNYYSFRNRYAEMGGYEDREIVAYRNVDELMGLIRPYVYQCTKDEVMDLPQKVYSQRIVSMNKDQKKAYKAVAEDYEAVVKDASRGGQPVEVLVDHVLAQYNALQQITGGFVNSDDIEYTDEGQPVRTSRRTTMLVDYKSNPKVKEVKAIAEQHGGPMIVWAKFRVEIDEVCKALREAYGDDCVSEYHGGLDEDQRAESKRRFEEGKSRFFVANQKTGGTGLTLNRASVSVYYSNDFQFVMRAQSEDRNHRIGQTKSVLYIDLVCEGTKDEDIMQSLREKKDVSEFIRESMAKG